MTHAMSDGNFLLPGPAEVCKFLCFVMNAWTWGTKSFGDVPLPLVNEASDQVFWMLIAGFCRRPFKCRPLLEQ
eukprot:13970426-Heterocapsa_arctica.AAC.1